MAVNKFVTEHILEIQSGECSEGFICQERIIVRAHDEGGGVFMSIKTENLEPVDEYDSHTVTLTRKDLKELVGHLESIFTEYEEV